MPWAEFELAVTVFERNNSVIALDSAPAVTISNNVFYPKIYLKGLNQPKKMEDILDTIRIRYMQSTVYCTMLLLSP